MVLFILLNIFRTFLTRLNKRLGLTIFLRFFTQTKSSKTIPPPSGTEITPSLSKVSISKSKEFWSSILEPQLHTLLTAASYPSTSNLVGSISSLLNEYTALGPKPSTETKPWPSFLSDDCSPIEYSISIAPDRMIVRFAFEPVSDITGTKDDPFNTITTTKWLDEIIKKFPYDLTWYRILRQHLMIDSSKKSPTTTQSQNLTQQVFAFDLEGSIPRLKIYIMPDALVRLSPLSQWISRRDEVITSALQATNLGTPWSLIRSYLSAFHASTPEKAGFVEALGWDACAPSKARQKAYVRFQSAGITDVLSHLDLGGRLEGEVFSEIKDAAREMWGAFVGAERDGGDDEKGLGFGSIEDLQDRTGGALLAYELREGSDEPVCVKFYYPVRYHFASDLSLAQRIDDFLVAKMGRQPGWYLKMMQEYCTHRKLNSRTGIQTFVGGTVRRGVWDLTVYIGPEGYAAERGLR